MRVERFIYTVDQLCELARLAKLNPTIEGCLDVATDPECGPFASYTSRSEVIFVVGLIEAVLKVVNGRETARIAMQDHHRIIASYNQPRDTERN